MAKKFKKNPWRTSGPIYIAAAVWLACSLILPLHSVSGYFVTTLASIAGWGLGKIFIPKTTNEIEDFGEDEEETKQNTETETKENKETDPGIKKRPRTGDKAIDDLLDEEEKAISEMRRLDKAIEDEKVSGQIVHLEEVTTKIVNYIVENPNKKSSVRKFFNYYLPTTLKLLNAYDRMDETGISGMNIDGTKGKVEEMMDTSLAAFDKQLDALYADDALDISAEIKVMENMLQQEGLKDDAISGMSMK